MDAIVPERVNGAWVWTHREDADAVRRIERETWQLSIDKGVVTGFYDRAVTFLSLDGAPFSCSQSLSYQLRTRYQFRGRAHPRHLALQEVDYSTDPSPCEGGFRKLGNYEGFLQDGQLLLIWKGGSQTLERSEVPAPAADRSHFTVDGNWLWHNASEPNAEGEVRVEREDWVLEEVEPGLVEGSYLRGITVYDRSGRAFACSGTSSYSYEDRYDVRGIRRGDRIVITETAVDAADHPCLAHRERHLDEAVASLRADHIELVWRGGHRQVLHRPPIRTGAISDK